MADISERESSRGELLGLSAGQRIPYGGSRWVAVDEDLARDFVAGDRLIVVHHDGTLVRVPKGVAESVDRAVSRAHRAFAALVGVSDDRVTDFYERFARALEDDTIFAHIARANEADVERARASGRAVGRLALSEKIRSDMIAALRIWRDTSSSVGEVVERVEHIDWSVTAVSAPLGVVGFVFEGRPNVFADATGVLRGGNTAVMRIGSDALGTAVAISARWVARDG